MNPLEKSFEYCLPNESGNPVFCKTENTNAVVIIGANGSGKSRLGAWIEEQLGHRAHRIAAQRGLNFKNSIKIKSYLEAERNVLYNSQEVSERAQDEKIYKWGVSGRRNVTTLVDDFDEILSAVISRDLTEYKEFIRDCTNSDRSGSDRPPIPITTSERLAKIWNGIFPNRKIEIVDSNVIAFNEESGNVGNLKQLPIYPATQLSDGERSALYFIAQIICAPPGETLIIDEPELHLHPALMNSLWAALEKEREDCLFIYITHDLKFAARHSNAEIIWVKKYSGKNWQLEAIRNCEMQNELTLEILGNRNKLLLVEGTERGLDFKLYSILYPNFQIIPCGGCQQVIERIASINSLRQIHDCVAVGIIDRDYRSDEEVESLREKSVYCLKVAEVENLFIVKEMLEFIARVMSLDSNDVVQKVQNHVIHERFEKQLKRQIMNATVHELKAKLAGFKITEDTLQRGEMALLEELDEEISFKSVSRKIQEKYERALHNEDYDEVLLLFNDKVSSSDIGRYFGWQNQAYIETVLRKLEDDATRDDIRHMLQGYIPNLD